MIAVERERKRPRYWETAIDPFFDCEGLAYEFTCRVLVHSEIAFGGDNWRPAAVIWYPIGPVPVEKAEAFAKAIQRAVEIGKVMDKEHGIP